MRWLPALATLAVAAGALGALAAPAAADPVVDIEVARTLNTPTDLFDVSPTRPYDADIALSNLGTAPQDASFSFTVPTGWTVTPAFDPGSDETCGRTAAIYTCTVTAIPAQIQRSTQLLITAAPGTPVGSITTVVVTGGPVGAVDSNPDNNTTQFRFRNVGTSNVVGTITQSATQVPVGGTVTFTIRLTNDGPDTTVGQDGSFGIVSDPVDGFRSTTPVGPGQIGEGGPGYDFTYDLAPRTTATYTVTWTALKLGAVAHLRFAADHQPGARDASGLVLLTSRDVTVMAATAPATPQPSATPTTPELAATGTPHVGGQVFGALGTVALGASLVFFARRRRGRHLA